MLASVLAVNGRSLRWRVVLLQYGMPLGILAAVAVRCLRCHGLHSHSKHKHSKEVEGKTFGTPQALLTFGLVRSRRGSSGRAGGVGGVGVGMSSERM
jgi:hypothetical protein